MVTGKIDVRGYLRDFARPSSLLMRILVLATIGVGISGYFLETDPGNLLNTLAVAQASVLAIVFSVTILGVQLIANRYSPRMTTLITEDRIFRGTFWLLVISATYDVISGFYLPSIPNQFEGVVVAIALLLSGSAVFSLWEYVTTALERSTPEGLIATYERTLTPIEIYRRYSDSEYSEHPFHELYEMAMSSLTNQEWLTTTKTLDTLLRLSDKLVVGLRKEGILGRIPSEREHKILEEPLTVYLPKIAVHANELEEDEIARKAVEVQQQIGGTGIAQNCPWLVKEASRGLRSTHRELPYEEGGVSVRTLAFASIGNLLTDTVDIPDPRTAQRLMLDIGNSYEQYLYRNKPAWDYHSISDNLFRSVYPETLEILLQYYSEYYASINVDWYADHPDRGIEKISALNILFKYNRDLASLSRDSLAFEVRNEEFPGTKSTMLEGWVQSIKVASENEFPQYAAALAVDFIHLAYADDLAQGEDRHLWVTRLQRLNDEGYGENIETAFDRCWEKNKPGYSLTLYAPLYSEKEVSFRDKMKQRFAGILEEDKSYREWLEEFKQDVFEDN